MTRQTSKASPNARPTSKAQAQPRHKQGAGTAASKSKTSRAPTDIDRQVGAHLRRIRLARNMTLADLGADLGISHQQLQKYETGTNRLSAGMLKLVADVLGVCILDFFDEAATPAEIEAEAASETAEIFTRIAELSQSGARLSRRRPGGLRAGRNLQDPALCAKAIPEGVRA